MSLPIPDDWLLQLEPLVRAWAVPGCLVFVRLLGLCWTAPVVSNAAFPARFRILLALLLTIVAAPVLAITSPDSQSTLIELARLGLGEAILGAAMGFGIQLLFAGIELAAGLVDQQAALATAQLLNPLHGDTTSPSTTWLSVLATLAFLSSQPVGGDLQLLRGVLDSFDAIPIGTVTTIEQPLATIRQAMQSSLHIGWSLALPVVVTLSLMQLLWGFITRDRGGGLFQSPLAPLRVLVSLLILTATLTEIVPRLAYEFTTLIAGP
ncbi:MAG: flagellar biosynthetic protein FliR [Planctomycetaceae bacterium]